MGSEGALDAITCLGFAASEGGHLTPAVRVDELEAGVFERCADFLGSVAPASKWVAWGIEAARQGRPRIPLWGYALDSSYVNWLIFRGPSAAEFP
jgi:hypothetical protein